MSEPMKAVVTSIEGQVGVMLLNRPESFNALSTEIVEGIDAALDEFEGNAQVRVILLRSSGKHFCTGANLKEALEKRKDPDEWAKFIDNGMTVCSRLENGRLPVIAEIQGLCLAGGLELQMCCDVIFAAQSARLGDQHAEFGLLPGWGGSQRLPRIVGQRRAFDLLYSARWVDASAALDLGLVNYVVDDTELQETTMAYCSKLAERSPRGIALMKELVRKGMETSLEEGLKLEFEATVSYMQGAEADEGLTAFIEKRKPVFK